MNPIFIIIPVVVIWAILFVVMMTMNKKRQTKSENYSDANRDKAIIHLYGSNLKVDGQTAEAAGAIRGEYLETVLALAPGYHSFSGVFKSTETTLTGKNVRIKTDHLDFDLNLERGETYHVALYSYSPEERKEYYKGEVDEAVLSIPLSLTQGSDYIKAYLIAYRERKQA